MYADYYVASISENKLAAFCSSFVNVIGPVSGQLSAVETQDSDGQERGELPDMFYACLRCDACLGALPEGIVLCERSEGQAVLGGWV